MASLEGACAMHTRNSGVFSAETALVDCDCAHRCVVSCAPGILMSQCREIAAHDELLLFWRGLVECVVRERQTNEGEAYLSYCTRASESSWRGRTCVKERVDTAVTSSFGSLWRSPNIRTMQKLLMHVGERVRTAPA